MKRNKPGVGSDYIEYLNKRHHDRVISRHSATSAQQSLSSRKRNSIPPTLNTTIKPLRNSELHKVYSHDILGTDDEETQENQFIEY